MSFQRGHGYLVDFEVDSGFRACRIVGTSQAGHSVACGYVCAFDIRDLCNVLGQLFVGDGTRQMTAPDLNLWKAKQSMIC